MGGDQSPGHDPLAEPAERGPPPTFAVLSLVTFGAFVGAAYWGALLDVAPSVQTGAAPFVQGSGSPLPVVTPATPPPQTSDPFACGPCTWEGTLCEGKTCRLAPLSLWQVRPFAIRRVIGDASVFSVCMRSSGVEPWVCSEASTVAQPDPNGDVLHYLPPSSPSIVLAREQIESSGFEVRVLRQGAALGDYPRVRIGSRLIAGPWIEQGHLRFPLGGPFKELVVRIEPAR